MESHVDITCHRRVQMHEGVKETWHEHITLTNSETGLRYKSLLHGFDF